MVKCTNCGFLTLRLRRTRELVEAESEFRRLGRFPPDPLARQYVLYDDQILCFARALDMVQAVRSARDGTPPNETPPQGWSAPFGTLKTLGVITEERQCSSFTPWIQGFTPKEHQEMLDRKMMLDWQADREREDREWREKEGRSNHRWRIVEFIVVGVVMPLLIVAATVLAAFIRPTFTYQPTLGTVTVATPTAPNKVLDDQGTPPPQPGGR